MVDSRDPVTGFELAAGMLLLAGPRLTEPAFAGSVILLLDHDAEGAVGVIINRSAQASLGEALPSHALDGFGAASDVIRRTPVMEGGPVDQTQLLALVRWQQGWDELDQRRRRVAPGVGLVDLLGLAATGEGAADPTWQGADVRAYAGYAGWGPGQLESEIADEAWFVVPSEPDDPFSRAPAALWRQAARRQPGSLAWLWLRPADVAFN